MEKGIKRKRIPEPEFKWNFRNIRNGTEIEKMSNDRNGTENRKLKPWYGLE